MHCALIVLKGRSNGEAGDEKIGYKSNETRSEIWFRAQFDKSVSFGAVQGCWEMCSKQKAFRGDFFVVERAIETAAPASLHIF